MKSEILTFLILFLVFSNTSFILAGAPDIDVTLLNHDPDPAEQGKIVEVRFKVENLGISTTEEVELEILPSYPFSLYSGDTVRKLGKLPASQTGADALIVDYKLKVDEGALGGDTEIELLVREGSSVRFYNDNQFLIDVQEYTTPKLKAYIKENTILKPNTKGTITIELANVDVTDVKFLQFYLLPSEDYELISSSNYVYMGDVDSDDTESEDFEIFVKDAEEVSIPVRVEYQDSNENNFEQEYNLSFKIYSSSELAKYGLKENGYALYIVIIIAIIIIWYIWKRKKNKR